MASVVELVGLRSYAGGGASRTATNAAGAAVTFTANSTITVNGNVSIGGGTTFNGSNFTHAVSGNWTNNGTFSGGNSTVTLNGSGALLTGAGSNNFNNLTLNAAGITADANTSLVVAGNSPPREQARSRILRAAPAPRP